MSCEVALMSGLVLILNCCVSLAQNVNDVVIVVMDSLVKVLSVVEMLFIDCHTSLSFLYSMRTHLHHCNICAIAFYINTTVQIWAGGGEVVGGGGELGRVFVCWLLFLVVVKSCPMV